jgi:cytochrome P450
MTWDNRIYANPTAFNPSRFLPKPEGDAEPFPQAAFGFGRRYVLCILSCYSVLITTVNRICPGRYLAEPSIWMAAATILATTNITKAVDENGEEITPSDEFTFGLTRYTTLLAQSTEG